VAHVKLFIHQYPQALLGRATLNLVLIRPTQTQDLALGLVEPLEVHTGPFFKLVQVLLDGILSFWCVNCSTQLGFICKLAEGALDCQQLPC